jgi:DNA gyrase/topoisomerase IV subunit A
MKINKELENKMKELEKEIKKIKNEYNYIKSDKEEIKRQLEKEKDKNNNIIKQLHNSKIRFTMRSHCNLGKCLDMKSLTYGNPPHLWDYGHHNQNQIFELINNNDDTYSIKSAFSDLYLGMDNDKIAFRRRNENSQSFKINHFDDGYYLFQNLNGGVIDLGNYETYNGASIGRWHRNNSTAQQWKLVIHL